jgi:hypothetical protein
VEGRALAKGNAGPHTRGWTPGRVARSRALDRVRQAAKERGTRVTALGHRPMGPPTREDHSVQRAPVEGLTPVYEPEGLGGSYGARPGRSPQHALEAGTVGMVKRPIHWGRAAAMRGL